MKIALSLAVGFGVTLALLFVLRRMAGRIGLVDGNSAGTGTPLIGGIAMFCGFVFGALLLPFPLGGIRALFAGTAVLVIVGVLDDFHELSSGARFVAQIVAGFIMIYGGGVLLLDLGDLVGVGTLLLGAWSIPLTVFAAVGIINAVNMADGVDGLAGGLVLVASVALALTALLGGQAGVASVAILLATVVTAFLLLNLRWPIRSRASVYMGDAGSMFLGFLVTWFAIQLSQGPERSLYPVTALWLVMVPLCDAVEVLLRRLIGGGSPFRADSGHIHHLLQRWGFSVSQTTGILITVAVAGATVGLGGQWLGIPEEVMLLIGLVLFTSYVVAVRLAWRRLERAQKHWNGHERRAEPAKRHRSGPERREELRNSESTKGKVTAFRRGG